MSPLDLVRRRRGPAPARPPAATSLPGDAAPTATAEGPRPTGTLAERAVARASSALSGGHSRRRFLARTAVVGSALAVDPLGFVMKPGTAYAAVCGTCSDGWTAFCCTINGGRNSCPPNTFVAGWWKADNAAYCCGSARYIIDCNATCPTRCSCRCSGASCDGVAPAATSSATASATSRSPATARSPVGWPSASPRGPTTGRARPTT